VGPSIDLAEIGYKKAREKRQEKIEKAGGKRIIRQGGGQVWEDTSLLDWADGKIFHLLTTCAALNFWSILLQMISEFSVVTLVMM
jgi:hypothetical protein